MTTKVFLLMTIIAKVKDLLKDPLTFKGKGEITLAQLEREKAKCETLLSEMIDYGDEIKSSFNSAFSRSPIIHLAYQRKKASAKLTRTWMSWRKRGYDGKNASFISLDNEVVSSELPNMQQLIKQYEYKRSEWQAQYNTLFYYRMSLDAFDTHFTLN